jgi:hypothetical protein
MIKMAACFSIFCGIGMLATWSSLILRGQVPELVTQPFETVFLLAAEIVTAITLISAGWGLLTRRKWGLPAGLIALGMLLYCAIYSVGVFGQQSVWPAVGFFVVVASLAAIFASKLLKISIN